MHTWTPDSGKKKNIKQGFPYEEQVQLDGVLLALRHFPPLVTSREIGALKSLRRREIDFLDLTRCNKEYRKIIDRISDAIRFMSTVTGQIIILSEASRRTMCHRAGICFL